MRQKLHPLCMLMVFSIEPTYFEVKVFSQKRNFPKKNTPPPTSFPPRWWTSVGQLILLMFICLMFILLIFTLRVLFESGCLSLYIHVCVCVGVFPSYLADKEVAENIAERFVWPDQAVGQSSE